MSNIKRYNGTSWEKIPIMADKATSDVYGNNISTTYAKKADVYTNTETDSKLSAKQDKLISGTNIKTVNGSSLLGSGDVAISAQDSRIYDYTGETYGHCYGISSPERDYSTQIGESGFTVDGLNHFGDEVNLLQVNSDIFQYRQSDVMTGETKYLQSKYFKHWHGMFVCPSNTYYYRLIAKATNSGSSVILYQTITIRGTIGGWGSSEQCEFMYVVALRNNNFSAANNIRKTIFRGSTYTEESTIASNTGLDIVTHRNSSTGELYVYLRSYGAQKYSQYDIIVTADGWDDVVTLPTDENFYTSSSGTLVSGSQLLSSTQNQCIEITNENLKTVNYYSLMGNGNLNIGLQMTNSDSGSVCFYARPSGNTTMTQIYSSFSSYTPYIVLPYQMPWFNLTWGTTSEWPSIGFLERTGGYIFHFRFYRNGSPMEYRNINVQSQVVVLNSCKIFKLI